MTWAGRHGCLLDGVSIRVARALSKAVLWMCGMLYWNAFKRRGHEELCNCDKESRGYTLSGDAANIGERGTGHPVLAAAQS